jgi:hypothetical protein
MCGRGNRMEIIDSGRRTVLRIGQPDPIPEFSMSKDGVTPPRDHRRRRRVGVSGRKRARKPGTP